MDYSHDHTPALVQDDVRRLRVAIVHDWLTVYGGAERVLEHMLAVMPQADVYTLVDFVPDDQRGFLGGRTPRTSFIQRLPFARKHYRHYLPLMPLAIEQFDLSGYDLVVSSSYAVAKGVITGPDQLHVSYVHSPVRFAWDLQHQYLRQSGMAHGVASWAVRALLHQLRLWDTRTANGVDHFLANSQFIARRVWKVYRRAAEVIYPPVDIGDFRLVEGKGGTYVTVSRLVPYKRVELLVEAFARLPDRHLTIIGAGPELERLRRVAPPNVELTGFLPDAEVRRRLERARAFLFAAEEDFGIVMVEAQACGTPVIAYGKGGACEVVRDLDRPAATGVLFAEQTADSIVDAIARFEDATGQIEPLACRRNAERFGHARFCSELVSVIGEQWALRGETRSRPAERDDPSLRRQRILASVAR